MYPYQHRNHIINIFDNLLGINNIFKISKFVSLESYLLLQLLSLYYSIVRFFKDS
ncbi:unnamed protein product [Commensalibacter papalotli (ex Botero et al. 2024)]|uniref:Uncharacterized protein n=1 Tax=Commensalibacter papalotli (ex Botero et al. 2024) TaxID=2972766 RepID=A0ABN8W6D2_9PROT|nr:unnamed protein product [Commensalibacter papalotli (ex Botero et al. 2024)]CAI3938234.1 unnamed protein product [Commensalibacter papalotli (ex Botero et al. 2024)]